MTSDSDRFVEFPLWYGAISSGRTFCERVRRYGYYRELVSASILQVLETNRAMASFPEVNSRSWRLPRVVWGRWYIAGLGELFHPLDEDSLDDLRDYVCLLDACRDHFKIITQKGVDWLPARLEPTEWLQRLSFLLRAEIPTDDQIAFLEELHAQGEKESEAYLLGRGDPGLWPSLSAYIQDRVANALASHHFETPRPLDLGSRSLDFGMYLQSLSNWISEARKNEPFPSSVIFESDIGSETSAVHLSPQKLGEVEGKYPRTLPAHGDDSPGAGPAILVDVFGLYRIEGRRLQLSVDASKGVRLTPGEREAVEAVIEAGREGLIPSESSPVGSSLRVHMSNIRKRLDKEGVPNYLRTPQFPGKYTGGGYAIWPD